MTDCLKIHSFLKQRLMTHKNLLKIIMETVNNPINIILKNPNILYHGFLLNIYQHSKYQQH